MIALLGFITVGSAVVLIMKNKMDPIPALIIIPVITCILSGFGGQTSKFIINGVLDVAPMGTMFIFATLFFGIIIDAGTLNPIIRKIFKIVGKDPIKIVLGTGILAMMVHLDGNGAVTFLIAIPAMLPLFDAVGMRRTTLATVVALSAGLMNTEPWAGTAQRCTVALKLTTAQLWKPLIIPFIVGAICILFIDYRLALQEKRRIGEIDLSNNEIFDLEIDEEKKKIERPKLFIVNIAIVLLTIGVLISGKVTPAIAFMVALALVLIINYPNAKDQKDRINAHAKEALLMSGIVFATGALVGVMSGTGMIKGMTNFLVSIIPNALGKHIALLTGIIGMPASLIFDPSSFYFGVLPVIAEAGKSFGVPVVETARAAFLGEMNMGFPISPLTGGTFLLISLAGVELGEHQKKTFPYAFIVTIVMLIASMAIGVIRV
ncbi:MULTISPECIES: CitMHS family transporter [Clostridium]|jgi:CitMHS family citrate-Mg2+:H+ or citrate-Ca2+:H+ symporter|uniref:CitMHS family transporter n=1 Tax=Clostridium lapidicellarium TaxID=3240931 RepID=A0ABV4DWZ4_9CLOT|nr:citrate:proton symporter [uncultured Clostridium sp.]